MRHLGDGTCHASGIGTHRADAEVLAHLLGELTRYVIDAIKMPNADVRHAVRIVTHVVGPHERHGVKLVLPVTIGITARGIVAFAVTCGIVFNGNALYCHFAVIRRLGIVGMLDVIPYNVVFA